jgi:predicted transcriptional regulator
MRKDYALLDQKIKAAYVAAIKATKEIPTETYIAEVCGTSQQTVSKHLTNINLDELVRPFKIFGNDVLMGLRNRASKGDAQAAKLFFALVYDWNEKIEHDVEGTIETIIKVHYEDEDEDRDKNEGV